MNLSSTFRFTKGVKKCPHCNGVAYFGVSGSLSFKVTCDTCGCSGPEVSYPSYWSKGGNRLWSRMYRRAIKPWNFRGYIIKTNGPLKPRSV